MPNGRFESLIVIPSGGYDVTITDANGGPSTVSLTADNTYYWNSAGNDSVGLLSRLATDFEAEHGGGSAGWALSISDGEGGTGKCTISVSSGTFTISWDDTALRDLLGFDGTEDTSAVASATGNDACHALWLPDCPPMVPFSNGDAGWDESDGVTTQAPTGALVSTVYNRRVANSVEWQMLSKARARTSDEDVTNESFQTWYRQSITGEMAWANPGGPVNYHPDADVDGTFTNYGIVLTREQKPEKHTPGYDSWYRARIDRLVKVP